MNLANRNKISVRDALPGADEAVAFEEKDYLKLHMSTMRKVEIIDRLLTTYQCGKLKHNSKVREIYDVTIPGVIMLVKESPFLLLIWTIIVFIFSTALSPVIQRLFGTSR